MPTLIYTTYIEHEQGKEVLLHLVFVWIGSSVIFFQYQPALNENTELTFVQN